MTPPILFLAIVLLAGEAAVPPPVKTVEEATELIRQGEYGRALFSLEPILKQRPKDIPGNVAAATACVAIGNASCAQKYLEVVAKLAPETPGYPLLLGRTMLLRADRAAARRELNDQRSFASLAAEAFTKALQENPGDPKTLGLRAMALQGAGRMAEARDAYDAWISASPRDPDTYGAAATLLAATDGWGGAEALIGRAPQDDPGLLHRVRFAVMRAGVGVLPWGTIQPLFDAVAADEPDAKLRGAMQAYSAIVTRDVKDSVLAMLSYLDGDPADRLGLKPKLVRDGMKVSYGPQLAKLLDGPLAPIHKVEPIYPELGRKARIEGSVILVILVRKDGSVGSAHVLASSIAMFDQPALDSVRTWRYKPVVIDGEPVQFPLVVRIDFRLT